MTITCYCLFQKQATHIAKQYFAGLVVEYCTQQNVDLSTLGCKTTVEDAKALIEWPTLADSVSVNPKEVHKLKYYKRFLYDVMPEEIFMECQNIRAQLLSELTREHAKSDLSLADSVENMVCYFFLIRFFLRSRSNML